MGQLDGKVAVITGGSSGIGLAIAHRFVEEGAQVFITGRRVEQLEEARAQIGRNVTAVPGDMSSLEDLDRLFQTVRTESGSLDILVANAAYVQSAVLGDVTPEHFDTTFDTNARGTFFTMQKALPLMSAGGSVVLIASTAHLGGTPDRTTYAATKAAIRSYGRTWGKTLAPRGIRVNVLSPGPIDTPIHDITTPDEDGADEERAFLLSVVPMGRLGQPREVAAAALFLASDESSFITGVDLHVSGGFRQM
jgi:NAD(P)-dependent dehydrogenase (short-subunit alcohol dehydrogenase family)